LFRVLAVYYDVGCCVLQNSSFKSVSGHFYLQIIIIKNKIKVCPKTASCYCCTGETQNFEI